MQKIFLFMVMFCAFELASAQSSLRKPEDDFKKLNWLGGTWVRKDMKPGLSGYESWQQASASEWHGLGVNMKGTDTLFVERLKLVIKGEYIHYVADIAENKDPVFFKLTAITENGFVCENPTHDFPKKITYQKEGNLLNAVISGNDKSISYLFEKKINIR